MKSRAIRVWLFAAGVLVLAAAGIGGIWWLQRPIPIALDDPAAAPIKDIVVKSEQLEYMVTCDLSSDVSVLDEVYVNTADYPANRDSRLMIATYLGEDAARQPGFLNFQKAYQLWRRSGDPYPRVSSTATPRQATAPRPTLPPSISGCSVVTAPPKVTFVSIAIRDERAVVKYFAGTALDWATLVRLDGQWRIANVRMLSRPG